MGFIHSAEEMLNSYIKRRLAGSDKTKDDFHISEKDDTEYPYIKGSKSFYVSSRESYAPEVIFVVIGDHSFTLTNNVHQDKLLLEFGFSEIKNIVDHKEEIRNFLNTISGN